jgi:hypothetical protein
MLKSDATRTQELIEHLGQVHALSQAVASAISAIEKNDLQQLETLLAVQETICHQLSGTKGALSSTATEKAVSGENQDSRLEQEIRQAHIALAQINRVYAALLKRARRSVGLIAALYRSHGEGYGHRPFPLLQRHTWSCEV